MRIDRITILKLMRSYLGEDSLTPEELEEWKSPPSHLVIGQLIRRKLYRPIKRWRRGTIRPARKGGIR